LQAKPRLLRLNWGKLLSAERAVLEACRCPTYQYGHALPLDRYLSPYRACGAPVGGTRTEEACPLSQPLVESLRTFPLYWPPMLWQSRKKGQ